MKAKTRITADIKPSFVGQGLATIPLAVIVVAVFYVQPSLWIFLGVLIAVALVWSFMLHRFNRPRWKRLVVPAGGDQVVLIARDGHSEATRLDRIVLMSSLIVCIRLAGDKHKHRLYLFPDSMDSADWQRLKARLEAWKASG